MVSKEIQGLFFGHLNFRNVNCSNKNRFYVLQCKRPTNRIPQYYFIVRIQIVSNRDPCYAADQVDSFRSGKKESDSVAGNVASWWWSVH